MAWHRPLRIRIYVFSYFPFCSFIMGPLSCPPKIIIPSRRFWGLHSFRCSGYLPRPCCPRQHGLPPCRCQWRGPSCCWLSLGVQLLQPPAVHRPHRCQGPPRGLLCSQPAAQPGQGLPAAASFWVCPCRPPAPGAAWRARQALMSMPPLPPTLAHRCLRNYGGVKGRLHRRLFQKSSWN